MMTSKAPLISAAVLLLAIACQPAANAAIVNGSSTLCQCTPRTVTSSAYLDSLSSYASGMLSLLTQISAQLTSLGLKFSDFPTSVLTRLLQISASASEATKVANALLASLNSSSSSSSSADSAVLIPECTAQNSLTFFGSAIYEAFGSGGAYSGGKWTVALSGGTLTIDYGVKSCTAVTQFVQQICVDGYPSQVYIFVQSNATASASLLSDSLTASSQSGAVCVTVNQYIVAFSVLPRSLKSLYSLMPNYQFSLTVTGCFSAIPARCTPTVAPTTTVPCVTGNALATASILPVSFHYNVQLSDLDGTIINATATGAAASTFLVDLTADGCRAEPNITQVCVAGNFKRMKIGALADYSGTIAQFPGSENVTAGRIYQRFCYNVNTKMAILAIQPAELFNPANTQFKFFPEARGCFDPVSSSCLARPPCVGPLEVGWQSDQLPQQTFAGSSNMTFTGGQWMTTGSDASLNVDFSAGGCRKTAAVTKVCVVSSNTSQVQLAAIFQVGSAEFFATNVLNGSAAATAANPWCQTYSAAPTMKTLYISFPAAGASPVSLRWTINGCFSELPAYCLTTTAAPTTTVATTTVRPAEVCNAGLPTLTNADADLPPVAISGGVYAAVGKSWTVAKGSSLTIDLTVAGCRQSAKLQAICVLGNAATVRIDYVLEDNRRVILGDSATASQPATSAALCFTFPSVVYAKSLVLLPTALKTASAGDATYSLTVNLSACYLPVSASCYSPVCSCATNYRPIFNAKKYYKISFRIASGYYSNYKSTYGTPITSDYQDLLNLTDTTIWLSFGDFKDKYEGIDQVAFTSGSVRFDGRLIMYDGGYSASALTSALTTGMSSYAASGSYVVNASSISITELNSDNNNNVATTAGVNLGMLLGLLIPLLLLLILVLALGILLCKARRLGSKRSV